MENCLHMYHFTLSVVGKMPASTLWSGHGCENYYFYNNDNNDYNYINNVKWYMKCFIYKTADVKLLKSWLFQASIDAIA